MNIYAYDRVTTALLDLAASIEAKKRPGYTLGDDDVLKNFKDIARRTGLTPLQVWAVYANKHFDAISSATCRPDLPLAESIEGRFADAINYLKLGYALIAEEQDKKHPTETPIPALFRERLPE